MGPGRFALPLALAGVAARDPRRRTSASACRRSRRCSRPPHSRRWDRCSVLAREPERRSCSLPSLLAFAAVGAWRQHATDPSSPAERPSVAALVDGDEHEIVGTVVDDPRPREDRAPARARRSRGGGRWRGRSDSADRLLVWLPRGIDAAQRRSAADPGRGRAGRGLRRLRVSRVPGAPGHRRHRARRARPRCWPRAAGPAALLAGIRASAAGGLNAVVPEPEAALGAGILLGVRASIAPEINDAFATAGLTHVVAISGWNIAIVAALVAAAGSPAGAAARRPVDERRRGSRDGRRLRRADRRQPIGRAGGAHGGGHARRAARRVARACRVGARAGRARHAAGRARRCCGTSASSCRCSPPPGSSGSARPIERRLRPAGRAGSASRSP